MCVRQATAASYQACSCIGFDVRAYAIDLPAVDAAVAGILEDRPGVAHVVRALRQLLRLEVDVQRELLSSEAARRPSV